MDGLQPPRARKDDKQRDEGEAQVACDELVEIRALLLDDPPAGLPGGSLAFVVVCVREREAVGGGVGVCGMLWRWRDGSAVHEAAVAKWLAERLVELEADGRRIVGLEKDVNSQWIFRRKTHCFLGTRLTRPKWNTYEGVVIAVAVAVVSMRV